MKRMWSTSLLVVAACADTGDAGGSDPLSADPWLVEGPTIRIGAVDDPDYAFGSVRGLSLGPDGAVYSMHVGEAQIRRWTPEGLPAGAVGREGEGPGEFSRPVSMGFFGDSLWVFDLDGYRTSYFDLEGRFLGSVTPRVDLGSVDDGPGSPPRPDRPLRDGTFLGNAPAWSEEIARGQLTEIPWVHMAAEGRVLSTLWTQRYRPTDVLALLNEEGRGGTFTSQPFGDQPLTATTDDGLLLADRRAHQGEGGASFAVTRIDPGGDTVWHRRMSYAPDPLPRERVDSAVSARAEGLHEFMSRGRPGLALGDVERRFREAMYAPEHMPPVEEMVVAEHGSVWLRRSEPLDGDMVGWWVLDAGGEPAGRAVLPAGLDVHVITEEAIWGVETDELDVSYIVRYRLIVET